MEFKDLINELSKYGLNVVDQLDGYYAVGSPEFANPLLFFSLDEEYKGNVTVKSINSRLFTSLQITKALDLVDEYLYELSQQ